MLRVVPMVAHRRTTMNRVLPIAVLVAVAAIPTWAVAYPSSEEMARAMCKSVPSGFACTVGNHAVNIILEEMEGTGINVMMGSMMKSMMCDNIYGNMGGITFDEGWRMNISLSTGPIIASCPLDGTGR